jgi:hypothetical protein
LAIPEPAAEIKHSEVPMPSDRRLDFRPQFAVRRTCNGFFGIFILAQVYLRETAGMLKR